MTGKTEKQFITTAMNNKQSAANRENQPILFEEVEALQKKAASAQIPPELETKTLRMVKRLQRMSELGGYSSEYETIANYIDWVVALPWNKRTEDNLDLEKAKNVLDNSHYGMGKVKNRILEYISVLNLTEERREGKMQINTGPLASTRSAVICFLGLPGTGKTSIAYSIAKALDREFIRIAMGGMGDSNQLRGEPRSIPAAEPGLVIKGLRQAESRNPVILLDEIDRVAEKAQAGITGVLLELLDPEQNNAFTDHYINFPFNLSEVLFLITCNSTRNIANAVLDRLEVIEMPPYDDAEKKIIAKDYLLPRALETCGLEKNQVEIEENLWQQIIRPLGYDAGIRTLDRTINTICRRVARKAVESGNGGEVFKVTEENVKEFIV